MNAGAPEPTPLRRLSSKWTWFYKRLFPVWWFTIAAIVGAGMIIGKLRGDPIPTPILFIPFALLFGGLAMFRALVWNNVDQVWDAGDGLVIWNGLDKELLPWSAVRDVTWSKWQNPETVTLMLYAPSKFGLYVKFLPTQRPFRFGPHPLIEELTARIEQARSAGVANQTER